MSTQATERYSESYDLTKGQLAGSDIPWVAEKRADAIESFLRRGFPSTREEDWKYTRVTPVENTLFVPPSTPAAAGLDEDRLGPWLIPGHDAHRLVFVDGVMDEALSSPRLGRPGVTLELTGSMLGQGRESLRAHLGRYADVGTNPFCALNTAFMDHGAVLEIAPHTVVEKPIHLVFLSTGEHADVAFHPRVLIVAGAGSRARLIEHYVGLGDDGYLSNNVTEAALDQDAELIHYKLQEEGAGAVHVSTLQVSQAAASRFVSCSVSLGAKLARHDVNSVMHGRGASCTLLGLYLARSRQHVDYHTRIDHQAEHCDSRELYKGIVDERGRGVFNGRVYVHPGAQKTNAEQANDNLLLSRDAEVDTKPQLEIYADDVKCAHGATVGQLDENMIFYLRARGIEQTAARGLLTFGFADEVLREMPLEPVSGYIGDKVLNWLPDAERLREIVS